MSGFLFNRRTSQEDTKVAPAAPAPDTERLLKDAGQVQAITAAAIFATLVSKGILSAEEAAELMTEIGEVIHRDVGGKLGASAGDTLRSYGSALLAADA
jgi:hypothetical protein